MIKTTFFTAFCELLNYFLAAFNVRGLKQDLQEAFSHNRVIHVLDVSFNIDTFSRLNTVANIT